MDSENFEPPLGFLYEAFFFFMIGRLRDHCYSKVQTSQENEPRQPYYIRKSQYLNTLSSNPNDFSIKDLDVAKAKKGKARKRMSEVGSQVFADLRRQAEQVINPMINEKLDEKLSQPFNFQMKESLGKTSPYLIDAFQVFINDMITRDIITRAKTLNF